MGDHHAQLKRGDTYQDAIAVLRVVEMIVRDAFDEPGPAAIIVESAEHGAWDDIVEIFKDTGAVERYDVWQIKRGAISSDDLSRLFRDLHGNPAIRRAFLGLRDHVDVRQTTTGPVKSTRRRQRKLGSTSALATLCEEAQRAGSSPSKLASNEHQRAFVQLVRQAVSTTRDEDVAVLLERFRIEILGPENEIGKTAERKLALVFHKPVDGILNALRVFVSNCGPRQRIDIDVVESEVLRKFATQRLPIPRTIREARARWLDLVVKHTSDRHVLAGVATRPFLRLPDVWIDVPPTLDREQKLPVRPLHERVETAVGIRRCIVLGEVGAGKTELLRGTAAQLARQAQQDRTAPVPLLVCARDLGQGIGAALRASWPLGENDALHLWAGSDTRFVILVDGIDEAGAVAISHIESLEQTLGNRLAGIFMASRPVVRFRDLRAEEVWIGRWSDEQVERFLDRWAAKEPNAVAALRASPHRKGIAELLARPLTATLCLLVAEREPEALRSRTSVYRAVITRLVDDWIQQRGVQPSITPEDLVPALELPALELVRRERAVLTEADLRRALGRSFENRETSAVAAAEVHLGLLVRRGDGDYDFAFRGLAEHLAGRALVRQGRPAVANAAHSAWGQEAARHALGWAEWKDEQGCMLMLALLEGEEEDDLAISNKHLRAVLVAVRAAGDLQKIDDLTSVRLFSAVWRRLIDEQSVWVGERVADAVQEWACTMDHGAEHVYRLALAAIRDARRSPAAWYAAQESEDMHTWFRLLLHRDPAVRGVAVEKLAPWVDAPIVRGWLYTALLDPGREAGVRPVAMEAGLVLRSATRDDNFEAMRGQLAFLIKEGTQFQRAGAALALRPGEAPPEQLAFGLLHGLFGSGFGVPPEVLEELAAAEGGRAALDRHAPDWNNARPTMRRHYDGAEGKVPPGSWEVRTRLLRAVSSVLHRVPDDVLGQIYAANRTALMNQACQLAVDFPKTIIGLLDAAPTQPLTFFWDGAPLALGRAAVRHPEVCQALIRLWERLEATVGPWSYKGEYPGRALEELIRRGHGEASRIYAEWLKHTNHAPPFLSFPEPLLLGADVPDEIRRAGREVAQRLWDWTTIEQLDENGRPTRGAPSVAGSGLYRLSSFWHGDQEFRRRIEEWLESEDFNAALWALQGVPLASETRQRIVTRAAELMTTEGVDEFTQLRWWKLLQQIERADLTNDFLELLVPLSDPASPVAMIATALRLPFCGEDEQNTLSKRIAGAPRMAEGLAPHLAERLVHAAPDAWADTLTKMLEYSWISGSHDWMPFIRALPVAARRRVAQAWALSAEELPWVPDNDSSTRCVRTADCARELLFDLGLDEPTRSEIDAAHEDVAPRSSASTR